MPKIKSTYAGTSVNGVHFTENFDIHYSSANGFYVKVPAEYDEIIMGMSSETKGEYFLQFAHKLKVFIVSTTSEDSTEYKYRLFFKYIKSLSIIQRDVIVVGCNLDARPFDKGHYNSEHIGKTITMGLLYATETISNKGGEPRYTTNQYTFSAAKTDIVLPDTPENRSALELLYGKLSKLHANIAELMQSQESLQTAIFHGATKLLN